jgi:hypothetical protein
MRHAAEVLLKHDKVYSKIEPAKTTTMTRQQVKPPPHVWERIEKVLDEQDLARKHTDKLISDSLAKTRNNKRLNFLILTMVGVSLIALILLDHFDDLRES